MNNRPMKAAIKPPVRKLILDGATWLKSYDGDTRLAATLVVRLASRITSRPTPAATLPICVSKPSGNNCALPYRMADAEKPITPTMENSAMGIGRPIAWPMT
ncbi:hypothetical protein D3C72_1737400 [compost metagenome]